MPYLSRSAIKDYLQPDAYALVTGATDGIGKAFALQLAALGFNIIIHGRDQARLECTLEEIKTYNKNCTVICLPHDAGKKTPLNVELIEGLNITVLINNVGMGPIFSLLDQSVGEIDKTITVNTIFPSQLTHLILKNMPKKALILNVSSYAGLLPPPYLAVYAGTKAYNNAFSNALSREVDSDREIIALITGSVTTGSNKKPETFLRPSAEKYAKSVIKIIGCGRKTIVPYWPHALQTWLISLLPESVIDRTMKDTMQKELHNI